MTSAAITFLGVSLPDGSEDLAHALETTLFDTVSLAVIDALPESALPEFEAVLKRADDKEIGAFLEANVPQAHDVIGPIMRDMHDELALFAG